MLNYLGRIISISSAQPDRSKIQSILEWPIPATLTQLRGFLGPTGYYRFLKIMLTLILP